MNGKYIINDINTYLLCGIFFFVGFFIQQYTVPARAASPCQKIGSGVRLCFPIDPELFFIARGGIFSELPRARLIGQKVAVLYL